MEKVSKIFTTILAIERRAACPFLMIGGHAVCAYGYSRMTYDIDLLIDEAGADSWTTELEVEGYQVYHRHPNFVQFRGRSATEWPLDLMLVDHGTFEKMNAEANETVLDSVRVRMPTLDHLIALKLHALRQGEPGRLAKDFLDVKELLASNEIDPAQERYRELFLKFGSEKLYADFLRSCGTGDAG